MAELTSDTTHVASANNALLFVSQNLDTSGWLQNTVNPYTFWTPTAVGQYSAEGQAFVLLMHAAWRDYVENVNLHYTEKAAKVEKQLRSG
jgi:hypothetical protein